MESITETQNEIPVEYHCGEPIKPTITIYDYMDMVDDTSKESDLIESFNEKLNTVENMTEYKNTLKETKKGKQLRLNAYKMIALGSGVLEEKYTNELKPYFVKINYPCEEYRYEETVSVKNKATNVMELKTVQKVKLINNLKNATTNNTKEIILTILEYFDITPELETQFKECLETLTPTNTEEITNGQLIKANSALWNASGDVTKNRQDHQTLELDTHIKTLEASINFINWKLKRITVLENGGKQTTLNNKFIDMEKEIQLKLKSDKTFASLYSLAEKFSLNTRPKRA